MGNSCIYEVVASVSTDRLLGGGGKPRAGRIDSLARISCIGLLLSVLIANSTGAQDLVAVTATAVQRLPLAVDNPMLGVVDGQYVVLGGYSGAPDSLVWSDRAYSFEDDSNRWEDLVGVGSSFRPDAALADVGGSLVIAGGREGGSWVSSVAVLRRTEGEITSQALPDLPIRLRRPVAVGRGQSVMVAGFEADGSETTVVQVYTLDMVTTDAAWVSMPGMVGVVPGELGLVAQNDGLYLAIAPDDGTATALHRHTAVDGWKEVSGATVPIDVTTAVALGQAHLGFLGRGDDAAGVSGNKVFSYSTVTDEWAEVGLWEGAARTLTTFPVGSSIVVGQAGADGSLEVSRVDFEVGKRHFFWLDYVMVAVYLCGMIVIGFYFSRRESGTDDFFVGGRRMPWWAVGFSLYATGTSAISFMAIPAKSYATDWLYLAQNAIGLIAIIPVAVVIVPLIRRLSITSTYEYLEMRFHVAIRLMGSVLAVVYQLGARMSVVLFLPALALSAVTGVEVVTSILFMGVIATAYTVLGGIKAVIWTDVVQVFVLLGGAFLCLAIIISSVDGGVTGLLEVASADSKMHMFDWRLDLTIPTVWLFLILATADTITWPRDQVMVQRVLSTKSSKEAGFSVWMLAAIVIPGSLLFFSMGTALYGFYKINPEKLSPLLDMDATFPFFIAAELPAGVAGLIIAALFAASMSTLDSSMNSVATILVVDFYKRFKKNVTDQASLRLAKWITVVTGVFGTAFALVLSRYSLPSLWDTFIMLTGLLGGGFGGVYALGMFSRRANWQGALVGIVSSIFITLAVRAYTNIHVLLYGGVAIISCIVIGYIVSLFFPVQTASLTGLTVFKQDADDVPGDRQVTGGNAG